MTAAVYIVGGRRDHEELRYSLRSLEANAPDVTQVWVVGVVPDWVKGVRRLELEPVAGNFADVRDSITRFVNTPRTPRLFYLMNEDHYVVEPVDGQLPVFHLGSANDYIEETWSNTNTWCKAIKATTAWVTDRLGVDDVDAYGAHHPLLFDRDTLREALADYPVGERVSVQFLYPFAGAGGPGVEGKNAKCKSTDDLAEKLAQGQPYLSGNQNSFNGDVGKFLRARFPAPSKWEKTED